METSYVAPQRPITPPSDRKSIRIQNESNIPYLDTHGEGNTTLKDIPYLKNDDVPKRQPLSLDKEPNTLEDFPNKDKITTAPIQDPFADVKYRQQGTTRQYQTTSRQRNDTTRRIEREALSILQWESPVRSGLIFGLLVGSIVLTRSYSLLQIGSSLLCIATGINLFYVNFILQSQKIVTNHDVSHPYSDVIHNKRTMVDRHSVDRYANLLTDLSETVVRALTRIVFVESTATSLKWMLIFFAIWKVSSVMSTMNIVLIGIISAFIFPRLYISNKDIVDAHIQKGQNMIQLGLNKAQTAASDAVNQSYTKSRFFVAKVGTTGTDAKNTLQKTSAVLKEE